MTGDEIIHVFEHSRLVSDNFTSEALTAAYVEALAALRAQQERDNRLESDAVKNAPLTLDELRQMDGEPVWVRSLDGNGKDIWAFVDADCEMVRIFVTRFSAKCMVTLRHFKTYGKTWIAYRHKQEEAQT